MKFHIYILTIISLIFQSCFTGIESTPKITLKDNNTLEKITLTDEQKFLDNISNQPFRQWEIGKIFIVCDNKISLIFDSYSSSDSLYGDSLTYIGYKTYTSVTGDINTQILLKHNDNDTLIYNMNASPQEIDSRKSFDIPFTIQKSVIESVKNKLINQEFYIITSSTYDKNGNNIRTPKFIPVTITNITHGNYQYPIKVEFNFLSKKIGCVYMTIGRSIQATRNFETIFSLKDPRNSYPKISDSNWQLITNNSVTPGMNKDECRLALGIPTHIDRLPTYSGVVEYWGYDAGNILIFEDGLLKEHKK